MIGSTINVSMVDVTRPPITTVARGRCTSDPGPVLNAMGIKPRLHRDWTRFVDIEIGIYSDRLEVISPGSLQNSMTIDKMLAGQRSTRNTIIMEIMRDYGYVDFRGMGLRTKVIPLMRSHNGCDPIFEATEDYLKVTLPRRSDNQ